jgi:hypothetical protein
VGGKCGIYVCAVLLAICLGCAGRTGIYYNYPYDEEYFYDYTYPYEYHYYPHGPGPYHYEKRPGGHDEHEGHEQMERRKENMGRGGHKGREEHERREEDKRSPVRAATDAMVKGAGLSSPVFLCRNHS